MRDWSVLRSFTQLEQLVLKRIVLHEPNFIEVLADLCSLTELAILDAWPRYTGSVIDAILAKTTLAALTFKTCSPLEPLCILNSESDMTQLTRLCWRHISIFPALCLARKIVHFHCITKDLSHTRKLAWMVENMPDLQSLAIENGGRQSFLPNRVFLQAKALTSLTIKGFYVERSFFEALGTLHSLTHLCLNCHKSRRGSPLVEFFTGVNHLANLRELMLITRPPHPVLFLDHLSGDRLKGLQVLRLPGFRPTADQLNSLFGRLPSLRQFFCQSTTICCLPDASLLKFP